MDFNKIAEKIMVFNQVLNKFNYGILIDNKIIIGDDIDFDDYVTISPKDFIKYKIGVCWDYAEFEALAFEKMFPEVQYQLYYIEGNNAGNSHTWLSFFLKDKYFIFESSWKSQQGISEFISETDMIDCYIKLFTKDFNLQRCAVYKYDPIRKYGLTPDEFMKEIFTNGELIVNIGSYYEDIIKPWEDSGFTDMSSYEE